MNANLAFAPIERLSALYESAGVDFFDSRYAGGDDISEHVEWVDFDGDADNFDEDAADAIIAAQGYERTAPWDYSLGEYAIATISKQWRGHQTS